LLSLLFRRVSANIAANRSFSGPAGKRLYAVGDVHGRLDLLDTLLEQIRADLSERPIEVAAVVFLGDLIDRGPDSAGVVERLSALADFPSKFLFLLGNHEEMLLRVLAAEPGVAYDWLEFGGDTCVESYGLLPAALKAMDEEQIARTMADAIPAAHVRFIEAFGDTFSFGDYLLVHAGIRPGVAIEDQQPHDLRWIRRPFLSDAHDHGVMVVHGHTISNGVDRRPNRLGIDTGAYQTGVLTAAVVEENVLRFLQTGGGDAALSPLAMERG
jgi:serine/threonine protein phosphatase 1